MSESNGVVAFLSRYAFREGGVCRDEVDIAVAVRHGNVWTVLLDPEAEVDPPDVLTWRQWLDMSGWEGRLQAGPEVFDPWFEARMDALDRVLEGPDGLGIDGDLTFLAERLGVLPDGSRQADLLSRPLYGLAWLTELVEEWLLDRGSPRLSAHGRPRRRQERHRGKPLPLRRQAGGQDCGMGLSGHFISTLV